MPVPHLRIAPCLVVVLLACTASADQPKPDLKHAPAPAPAKPTKTMDSPESRGRAILAAQLAALANDDAFIATFAKQATVLTPLGSNEVHASNAGVATAIAFMHPHAEIKSATFDHFSAGGNAQVNWFAAELHVTIASHDPGSLLDVH